VDDISIRRLRPDEFALWRALRLRGLHEHPEAFGMSHEDEALMPESQSRERFDRSVAGPDSGIVGAFLGETLVGCFGYARPARAKQRHSVGTWGMYVTPEARGRGAGRALLRAVVAEAGALPGVSRITLCVMAVNEAAWRLYESEGFEAWGREPNALLLEDCCLDQIHLALDLNKSR
jgi:RimJ/RimL family protein N-acetyltransferase